MATRLKTIQFAIPTYKLTVESGVDTNIGNGTIYFPENSGVTPIMIKSCYLEIGWQDVCTAAGTIGEHRVGLTLGDADTSTIIETDDITQTGENMGGVIGPFDFTDYCASNISTGASISYQVNVYFNFTAGTNPGVNNVSAILTITYEYEDIVTTQIKTVWIPLESKSSGLNTSEEEIGINQIPLLDNFLPEDFITIRDYFFIIEGNQNAVGTNDIIVSLKIDSETQHDKGTEERALSSDIFTRYVWSRTSDYPSTNSVHAFKAWANVVSYHHMVITMVVTYEFNSSTTTSCLNSIYVPLEISSPLGLDENPSVFQRNIFIQESNIVLKQSSFRFNYNANSVVSGLNFKSGIQSYREYTNTATMVCGMISLQQRIDSGSEMGTAFLSFNRGINNLILNAYNTDITDDPTNLNGYFLINYQSSVHANGVGSHSHTIFYNLYQWDALLSDRLTASFAYYIPETSYWINSIGIISIIWDSIAGNAFIMDIEVKTGEGKGGGFIDLYADAIQGDAERRCSIVWMRGRDAFKRFPTDMDSERVDATLMRNYRFFTPNTTSQGLISMCTYHSITYPVSGNCTNYSGDGADIDVYFYTSYDNLPKFVLTTDIGGTFSGIWYDNTEYIYAVARENNNRVGRSSNGYAG